MQKAPPFSEAGPIEALAWRFFRSNPVPEAVGAAEAVAVRFDLKLDIVDVVQGQHHHAKLGGFVFTR